jgi:TetR/AcrR family acrAB operon transcriptional repressor
VEQRRVARKRTSQAEQSKDSVERILGSALQLMVSRGFAATTVDDIAANVGLTKGAIYFHFENKTEILLTLLDQVEKLLIGGLMDRVMHAGDGSQAKLVAALHSQGSLATTKARYMLLFTLILLEFNGTQTHIEARVRQIYGGFTEAFEKILREGRSSGEFVDTLETRDMAAVILALQHGALMEWYCRSDTLNGPALVRASREILLYGLIPRSGGKALMTSTAEDK